MSPLWRPMVTAGAAALAGAGIDWAYPLAPRGGAARWPVLVFAALLGLYLVVALPALAALVVVTLVATRLMLGARRSTTERMSVADRRALALTVAVFAAVMLVGRPSTPRFWDAFVWLAKARFAAGGVSALIAGGLHSTTSPFVPEGYPLFEPMLVASMGCFSADPRAVVAGAIGFELLACVVFLSSLVELEPEGKATGARLAAVAFVLLTSPLVFVHLRSSYVDLPLGFIVAAFAMLLVRPGTGTACAVLAMAAAALKDEGLIHVIAIVLAAVVQGIGVRDAERERLTRRALFVGIAAVAISGAWRVRVAQAGMANSDHALMLLDWHRVSGLVPLLLSHLSNVRSWGGLWALTLGASIALAARHRSAPRVARWMGAALGCQAVAMGLGLLAMPERVMEFAVGGTLLNRLAMQLAPTAAVFLVSWLMPGAA